ncbi:hypothetical protein CBOVI_01385 [Corynebacterium bovis DSM 20582 = CIP 54.80]|uniref:Uncharacterized protein n=1 Tax=Corynebacterium bovis DSM 20582 = CIP 54.80 TaxID=927655 RepID=A0A8I0CQE1_9CORY|nr:hypothetical protein [Corynebacterium bovis DSM 20582 = CIP 54.80]WJY76821.1 hypothetical protein CBOVI_01385 [Corynebacterium bovis DSM 20582 = CIP 54.80]
MNGSDSFVVAVDTMLGTALNSIATAVSTFRAFFHLI